MVYDFVIQALAGVSAVQTGPDGSPQLVKNIVMDKVTSLTVMQAVTAALFARSQGKGGQHVQISMLDTGLYFMGTESADSGTAASVKRAPSAIGGDAYTTRPTADGHVVLNIQSNSTWPRIQKAFAEFEWTTDALFASFDGRSANMHELQRQVEASLATLSSEEAVKRMRENDLPGARVLPLAEIPNDPQVQHNGSFVVGEGGPGTGPMRLPRPAPLFSGTPVDTGFSPAPALGADTVEVLTTVGYSAARISAMKDDGVLGPTIPPPTIPPP
jgi:crotonobetainyl-CoA:carnitine CoA-transferase CaiB-like acyl-CoA transferase